MPEEKPEYRVDDPVAAMNRMKGALKQILTVSKPEILRREKEAKEQRKRERKKAA